MAEYKKLKYYFDRELALLLADKIKDHVHDFNEKDFINCICDSIDNLELKARVELIADCLHQHLPDKYEKAVSALLKILGPENESETGMFTIGYWLMPIAFFVEKFGLNDFLVSVKTIYEITKRHTGAFAVRPFLEKYPEKMLDVMHKWSTDENVHVRRLSSEGIRPRLPWARKLELTVKQPQRVLPILENLKQDKSKFVQKSVANCLNDILKDNYETAISVLKTWSSSSDKNTLWIVKHALRNEIRKNNPDALVLIRK